MYSLLIAEDEEKLRFIVKEFFVKRGFEVWEAADGEEAVHLAEKRDFDLILLDVMMPNMDGFEACRKIRGKKDVPILFLTARTSEEDQLRGFQLEADDYVIKPFSLPVLHARVCALLKRSNGGDAVRELRAEGILVNLETREVQFDGEPVSMPPRVYNLLVYLMRNQNRILTRQQILDQVWGEDIFCYDRVVDTTIKKLRHALGDRAGCIRTIVKVGYKFQEEKYE